MPLVFVLGGCGLFGGSSSKGPRQVEDLVEWVERVYVDSELSRERLRSAFASLETIVSSEYQQDAVSAYGEFVARIEFAEQQASSLRAAVDPMKEIAVELFDQWDDNLEQFHSESIRQRSRERMDQTRGLYEKIVTAVDPSLNGFEDFNRTLRDHALFLENDFNPNSISMIYEDVRLLAERARELDRGLEDSQIAARAYIESSALPTTTAATPPGAAPQVESPMEIGSRLEAEHSRTPRSKGGSARRR